MLFKRLSSYFYNEDTLNFLEKNGLSIDSVATINDSEREIVEGKDIDSIVEFVSLFFEEENKIVSIADVVGYDEPKRKDIFESISTLFDSNGDTYYARSVGMLDYSSDEVVSSLERSFIVEPMKVKEIANDKYLIDGNGMHRYTVLRIHYLLDKYRGMFTEEELRKKYEIPFISKKLDKIKTYCSYLLKLVRPELWVKSDIDEDYRKTGKVNIFNENTKERLVLADDELIVYVQEIIANCKIDVPVLIRLSNQVEKNKEFLDFLQNYFTFLLDEIYDFTKFKCKCSSIEELYDYKKDDIKKERIGS